MITYEYRCDFCDNTFEIEQKISDEQLNTCSKCLHPLVKVINSSPFILKGKGWAKDGY